MTDLRAVEVKERLARSRASLQTFAATMTEDEWNMMAFSEGSEWRMLDILRHVADSERGMTALIVQIKAGGEGVPEDFDLNRWNQRAVTKLQEKTAAELLAGMEASRVNLLTVIDVLDEDDWDKKGRHASLKIMTIEEVCELIADHEMAHTEAMTAALQEI